MRRSLGCDERQQVKRGVPAALSILQPRRYAMYGLAAKEFQIAPVNSQMPQNAKRRSAQYHTDGTASPRSLGTKHAQTLNKNASPTDNVVVKIRLHILANG